MAETGVVEKSAATAPRADLCGLRAEEFVAWGRNALGFSPRFHRALYRHLLATGGIDAAALPMWVEAERTRPGICAQVREVAAAVQIPTVDTAVVAEDPERGRTVKMVGRLADGERVETVLIPMGKAVGIRDPREPAHQAERKAHHTVCVSSQVGCRMGCAFCHTARMGLRRNLAVHEIVGQVVMAGIHGENRPRNVVFMGMGEPLDNADAVAAAVRVLTDVGGLAIAHHHITVSTVGRVDVLPRWHELGLSRVNLAVSLGAADDALRSQLMPVNRTAPLAQLKRALVDLRLAEAGRRVLVACVLIPGVNDRAEDAMKLKEWIDGLPVLVNLIPFNPIPGRDWRAPSAEEVAAFRNRLQELDVPVRLRTTKGERVMAACGQLGRPGRRET
jgi:23S rRNA (adenine2503-C2)-methyltransferase